MARILILVALLSGNLAAATELLWPLADHEFITGGHADSRIDHFHGGVDIRTGGANLPVLAPMGCWVERVAVTPSGYGKVIYLRLDNSMTAVFGHLSRFAEPVEDAVRDTQLVVATYRIDVSYDSTAVPFHFERGDIVAYTGETGRGAPHLHYELREEAVQTDPLALYSKADRDPPSIVELRWIKLSEFTPRATGRKVELNRDRAGNYSCGRISADEPIAFFIACYDVSSWNRPAVPTVARIRIGEAILYETPLTRIDLLGPKDIYGKLVWSEISRADRDLRRLFSPPASTTSGSPPEGWITKAESDTISIEVADRGGSVSIVQIPVTISEQANVHKVQLPNVKESAGFTLRGDPVSLSWINLNFAGPREVAVGRGDDVFFDRLTLSFRLTEGEDRLGNYWYKRSASGGRSPLWTIPDDEPGIMSCYLQRGGTYGIARDETPPVLQISKRSGGLAFTLRDPETGIDDSTVRCTVNGSVAIPEYEYEQDGGQIWTQSPLTRGDQRIVFTAANRAGVTKTWEVTVTLP